MNSEEELAKKRKIDAEVEAYEDLREDQDAQVRAIASNIKWLVRYATDLHAMTEMDAEPGTILNMMKMYVEDNWDKDDEFKKLTAMILEQPDQPKK